ncbi:hypothetical protein VTK73DRAFT_7152 [Phialemonium thermophilum]|uniref:Uncharacterized protein n=1 Tax=Phialemonium thermophilum TaxID=223376 RepID=A0ABR3WFY5_9PEZI
MDERQAGKEKLDRGPGLPFVASRWTIWKPYDVSGTPPPRDIPFHSRPLGQRRAWQFNWNGSRCGHKNVSFSSTAEARHAESCSVKKVPLYPATVPTAGRYLTLHKAGTLPGGVNLWESLGGASSSVRQLAAPSRLASWHLVASCATMCMVAL